MQPKEKTLPSVERAALRRDLETVIIGFFLLAASFFQNGAVVFLSALCCVLSAALCRYFSFRFVLGERESFFNLEAVSVGLLVCLLLPSSAPLYVGASAAAFAVLVCVLPFGSVGNAPFVPAAAAMCFASLCFPQYVFSYPSFHGFTNIVFANDESFVAGTSLSQMLSDGTVLNVFSLTALLSGSYPSATGTGCVPVLLAAAIFIAIRRPRSLIPSAAFVVTCGVYAFLFPRISSGRMISVLMELCAGSLLFAALFLVNDSVLSPKKTSHAIAYGAAAGVICMLLRSFFTDVEPSCLAVMAVNALLSVFKNRTAPSGKKGEA